MSLARAILHDPKILLLDEPFSNVDAQSAREMVTLLTRMRDAGKTILLVTHQASLLEGAANKFVWMRAGQVVECTNRLSPAGAPFVCSPVQPPGPTPTLTRLKVIRPVAP